MSRCPDCGMKECCGASMSEELERYRNAVKKVQLHLRDADAGVLRMGLRDNDDSRAALDELFLLAPNASLSGGASAPSDSKR